MTGDKLSKDYSSTTLKSEFPIINSILEEKQIGKIFTIEKNQYAIIHKCGFGEILGKNKNINPDIILDFLLEPSITSKYFHIYNASDELEALITINNNINFKSRKRIQLEYPTTQFNNIQLLYPTDEDLIIEPLSIHNFEILDEFKLDIGNKFWNSKNDFLENGYGYLLKKQNNIPISVCYSAAVDSTKAEIDIFTQSLYQRKGYAKILLSHFLFESKKRNIIANWDCFEENLNSLHTAINSGFIQTKKYKFLSIFKKDSI